MIYDDFFYLLNHDFMIFDKSSNHISRVGSSRDPELVIRMVDIRMEICFVIGIN